MESFKLNLRVLKLNTIKPHFMDQSTFCSIPIPKVDASISSDLTTCNKVCCKKVIIEICDNFISKENNRLIKEPERLMEEVATLKGKYMASNVQLSKDNCDSTVKKIKDKP